MYEWGLGVAENYVEAYKWYILAGAQGDNTVPTLRNRLSAKMSAEQIAEAQGLAKEFKPKLRNNAASKADEAK